MSVIVEMTLPAREFELGRILAVEDDTGIVLETMVPLGEQSIPFFRLHDGRTAFEQKVNNHPAVEDIQVVSTHNNETLYALDWRIAEDTFFNGLVAKDAHILEATGSAETWRFELRFPSHDTIAAFQEYCVDARIPVDITRVYNPTKPDAGPWYGVTPPQREALTRAVEAGYYSIPRQISTQGLADELGISDQAVTERLRRGVRTLVSNTLLLPEEQA